MIVLCRTISTIRNSWVHVISFRFSCAICKHAWSTTILYWPFYPSLFVFDAFNFIFLECLFVNTCDQQLFLTFVLASLSWPFFPGPIVQPFVPAFCPGLFVPDVLTVFALNGYLNCKHAWLTIILSRPFCTCLFVLAFLSLMFWQYFPWIPICKHVWSKTGLSELAFLSRPFLSVMLLILVTICKHVWSAPISHFCPGLLFPAFLSSLSVHAFFLPDALTVFALNAYFLTCVINKAFCPGLSVLAFFSHPYCPSLFVPDVFDCMSFECPFVNMCNEQLFCPGLSELAFMSWPFCPWCFWLYLPGMLICKQVWSTTTSHFWLGLSVLAFCPGPFVWAFCPGLFVLAFLSLMFCLECLFVKLCDQQLFCSSLSVLVFLSHPYCLGLFVPDVFNFICLECPFVNMCDQQLFCPGLSVLAFLLHFYCLCLFVPDVFDCIWLECPFVNMYDLHLFSTFVLTSLSWPFCPCLFCPGLFVPYVLIVFALNAYL